MTINCGTGQHLQFLRCFVASSFAASFFVVSFFLAPFFIASLFVEFIFVALFFLTSFIVAFFFVTSLFVESLFVAFFFVASYLTLSSHTSSPDLAATFSCIGHVVVTWNEYFEELAIQTEQNWKYMHENLNIKKNSLHWVLWWKSQKNDIYVEVFNTNSVNEDLSEKYKWHSSYYSGFLHIISCVGFELTGQKCFAIDCHLTVTCSTWFS